MTKIALDGRQPSIFAINFADSQDISLLDNDPISVCFASEIQHCQRVTQDLKKA